MLSSKKAKISYILIHALFWCSYCVSWSYTAVYLYSLGFTSSVAGLVTGIGAILSVALQPVLAILVRKVKSLTTKRNIIWLKILTAIVGVFFMSGIVGGVWTVVLFTVLTCVDASIPSLMSTLAMDYINNSGDLNYGVARGLGSIAYAFCSLAVGFLVSGLGAGFLMILYVIFSVLTVLIVIAFPAANQEFLVKDEKKLSFRELIKEYSFLPVFLAASVLLYMGHNMVNVFLINIVEAVGGESSSMGINLFISAFVELPVMSAFVWIARKIDIRILLGISGIAFTAKSVVTMLAGNVTVLYVASFMQFGAFALYTPASVYFINKYMKKAHSSIGQALVGSCTLGLGGTLGNLLGGFLIDGYSIPVMLMCAIGLSTVGAVGMIVAMRMVKE